MPQVSIQASVFRKHAGNELAIWRWLVGKRVNQFSYGDGKITDVKSDASSEATHVVIDFTGLADLEILNLNQFQVRVRPFLLEKNLYETLINPEKRRQWKIEQEAKIREIEEEERRKKVTQPYRDHYRQLFESNFLSADKIYNKSKSQEFSHEDFQKEKIAFVKSWFQKASFKFSPDDEQADAIASVGVAPNTKVVARAGSGKTSTLVGRTLFLLQHCGVPAGEMLLLAFNRKASVEIRERLLFALNPNSKQEVDAEIRERTAATRKSARIDHLDVSMKAIDKVAAKLKVEIPHVMTFHALAYALVHPEERLLYDGPMGENQAQSRVVQQVIDDHFLDPDFMLRVRSVMLNHFREDWNRILAGGYNQNKEDLLVYRRSLTNESLRGDYVKSFGEKIIADFLFEHDIDYQYEKNHWWSNLNYRPDFTVFTSLKSGLIIEYFGLKGDPDYDEMSDEKRKYWHAKVDWLLVEFSPKDITANGAEGFCANLKSALEANGVACRRLSEDEIWLRVRERAIDRFTKSTVGFIGRCRKKAISPRELRDKIDNHKVVSPVESEFLELALRLYGAYLERLSSTGEEDFDGLMQRAADAVAAGKTRFERRSGSGDLKSLRYVFIDEFQDFSFQFYRLISEMKENNQNLDMFCVGDDWQAINGFAGSDLIYFSEFKKFMGAACHEIQISTNYRSASSIVDVGNMLMNGFGKLAVPHLNTTGSVRIADLNAFEPSLPEREQNGSDVITPAVVRLCNKALENSMDVVMLCRRNFLPWYVSDTTPGQLNTRTIDGFLAHVRSHFPKDQQRQISASTVHGYKGLESKMVIVLDAVARSYPLIHPNWVFSQIFGDNLKSIAQEERRLFYVALTRAIETLVILTDGTSQSPFLGDLRGLTMRFPWEDYPPVTNTGQPRLIVRVGNQPQRGGKPTHAIKDLLKAANYQWNSKDRVWEKTFPAETFQIDSIKSEIWSKNSDGIEVRILDDAGEIVENHCIDSGKWKPLTN